MSGPPAVHGERAPRALDAAPPRDPRAKLRDLANQLEGIFLTQLFSAMRASVPHEGIGGHTQGEEMFQSLLDERVAGVAAERLHRGLGEALYRQLAGRLDAADGVGDTEGR